MYKRMEYRLPKETYMQTIWFIRSYPRLKEEYNALFCKAPDLDGLPRGTTPGDPTGQIAVRSAELSGKIKAIEGALKEIPKEYRQGVFENIVYRVRYPDYAHYNTWRTWRQRFVAFVAMNAKIE